MRLAKSQTPEIPFLRESYAYSMGVYREDGAKIRTYTKISANEDEVRQILVTPDHHRETIKMAYYDGDERFKRYLGRKEDTIRFYVERDVDSMMELGFKCKDAYLGLTGLYIENYYTLASVGYNYYKTIVPKKYWDKRPMMDEKLEKFVREGICGGRSQVFQPYSHPKEEVGEADVKSQYPYEMASNEYPLGDEIWTKKYHPEGVYWAETGYVFKEFLEKLYKTKKEQDHYKKDDDPRYNPSLRNIVKLLMNALSGLTYGVKYPQQVDNIKNRRITKMAATCQHAPQ
ncbi:hypothetical protein BGZ89_011810 [Linnemannia elongata]|nr:hypothetical protein BGZ89_011810 [Linnemannia elongata]